MLHSNTPVATNDYDYLTENGLSKAVHENNMSSGPNIIFESRISELEAQLAQAEIDMRKLVQENSLNKKKLINEEDYKKNDSTTSDSYLKQIETLQR